MTRCQALTKGGQRCKRDAAVDINLRKIKIPYTNKEIDTGIECCSYCKQHSILIGTLLSFKILQMYADSKLSYDEYYMLRNFELDK